MLLCLCVCITLLPPWKDEVTFPSLKWCGGFWTNFLQVEKTESLHCRWRRGCFFFFNSDGGGKKLSSTHHHHLPSCVSRLLCTYSRCVLLQNSRLEDISFQKGFFFPFFLSFFFFNQFIYWRLDVCAQLGLLNHFLTVDSIKRFFSLFFYRRNPPVGRITISLYPANRLGTTSCSQFYEQYIFLLVKQQNNNIFIFNCAIQFF